MTQVYVSGAFDDLRSSHIRFLEQASQVGALTVVLWPDEIVARENGACKFPFEERRYLLESVRFVDRVVAKTSPDLNHLGRNELLACPGAAAPLVWATLASEATEARVRYCSRNGLHLVTIHDHELQGFPTPLSEAPRVDSDRQRVVVTGSFDWFHSGHVRFFEECSQLGDLYAIVGHDANIRLLKGEGHPLLSQDERHYVVAACRYVRQAMISTGSGWMDAAPEIDLIRPHIYAVNEDGDKPEKRAFCAEHRIEYVVLRRSPKEGLPKRSSTDLRGF